MNSKEKIQYVADMIREKARITPPGFVHVDCFQVLDIEGNGGIPDEADVLMRCSEQISILQKFEKDHLIFFLDIDEDCRGAWMALDKLDKYSDDYPYDSQGNVIEKETSIEVSVRGGVLIINEITGFVKLNKKESILNPGSKEFRIILTLAKNDKHQATYSELIGEKSTKDKARMLGFSIRNLKKFLGILPGKKAINKDIIENIKKYGYKLIT